MRSFFVWESGMESRIFPDAATGPRQKSYFCGIAIRGRDMYAIGQEVVREDQMVSEKRKSTRQPFSKEIDFEAMIAGVKRTGVARHRAHCLDISEGGLGITTRFKPREGEVLKLLFPFKKQVMLPVFAEVMWLEAETDTFRAGMRFLS